MTISNLHNLEMHLASPHGITHQTGIHEGGEERDEDMQCRERERSKEGGRREIEREGGRTEREREQ